MGPGTLWKTQVRPSIAFDYGPEPRLADRLGSARAASPTAAAMPPVPSSSAEAKEIKCATFLDLYDTQLAFVWNGVKRLGVEDSAIEDVVQEIFLVVHRRLADFEGRSSIRPWLFGIAIRVVRHHRRKQRAKGALGGLVPAHVNAHLSTHPASHQRVAR